MHPSFYFRRAMNVQDIPDTDISFLHIKKVMRKKPKTPEDAYDHLLTWTIEKLKRFGDEKYSRRITNLTEYKDEYIQVFREVFATWKEKSE